MPKRASHDKRRREAKIDSCAPAGLATDRGAGQTRLCLLIDCSLRSLTCKRDKRYAVAPVAPSDFNESGNAHARRTLRVTTYARAKGETSCDKFSYACFLTANS